MQTFINTLLNLGAAAIGIISVMLFGGLTVVVILVGVWIYERYIK